jgi:LysM repeat protein
MSKKIVWSLVLISLIMLMAVSPVAASGTTWHVIKRGETLFSIGRYYHISPWDIAAVNDILNPNRIYAGQRLLIPQGHGHPPPNTGCGTYYTVQRGDTLTAIGYRYGINVWRLAQVNGIYNLNYIWAGQRLYIPCY